MKKYQNYLDAFNIEALHSHQSAFLSQYSDSEKGTWQLKWPNGSGKSIVGMIIIISNITENPNSSCLVIAENPEYWKIKFSITSYEKKLSHLDRTSFFELDDTKIWKKGHVNVIASDLLNYKDVYDKILEGTWDLVIADFTPIRLKEDQFIESLVSSKKVNQFLLLSNASELHSNWAQNAKIISYSPVETKFPKIEPITYESSKEELKIFHNFKLFLEAHKDVLYPEAVNDFIMSFTSSLYAFENLLIRYEDELDKNRDLINTQEEIKYTERKLLDSLNELYERKSHFNNNIKYNYYNEINKYSKYLQQMKNIFREYFDLNDKNNNVINIREILYAIDDLSYKIDTLKENLNTKNEYIDSKYKNEVSDYQRMISKLESDKILLNEKHENLKKIIKDSYIKSLNINDYSEFKQVLNKTMNDISNVSKDDKIHQLNKFLEKIISNLSINSVCIITESEYTSKYIYSNIDTKEIETYLNDKNEIIQPADNNFILISTDSSLNYIDHMNFTLCINYDLPIKEKLLLNRLNLLYGNNNLEGKMKFMKDKNAINSYELVKNSNIEDYLDNS